MTDTTVDLLTVDEVKSGLNITISDTNIDDELGRIITAVSQRFRDLCGSIVNTTYTDEPYNGDGTVITLRNASATSKTATTSVTAVKEYDNLGTLYTLTAETFSSKPQLGYFLSAEPGARNLLYRRTFGGDAWFFPGRGNILVTYTTGRAANTAAVPAAFKEAAIIAINHIWSSLGAQSGAARAAATDGLAFGIPTFSIPKAALDLIRDEINPPGVG